METEQITKTFSDDTALYRITDYKATTVGEFVDEVLKERPRDWGYIDTPNARCEYRDRKLLTTLPEEVLTRKIKRVEGYGGWSRMDYKIKTI